MPSITNEGIAEFAKCLATAQNLRTLKLAIYEYLNFLFLRYISY